MQKFIVEGGVTLSGSITPSGNKNEALPVLAAALLANKPVIIHNVPEILDISIMKDLLSGIGVVIKQSDKHSYYIDPGILIIIQIKKIQFAFVVRFFWQGLSLPEKNPFFCLLLVETGLD